MPLSDEQLTSMFGQGLRRIEALEDRIGKIESTITTSVNVIGKQNAELMRVAATATVELRALKDAFKLVESEARSVEVGEPRVES